jgi:hypothetical protein
LSETVAAGPPAAAGPAHDALAPLYRPSTIRLRCSAIARAVGEGRSGWFTIDRTMLPEVAARVAALTRTRFPDLRVPLHSRWRHFEAGGVDRKAELDRALDGRDAAETTRARIDLTVVSVLLDAGAGPQWRFSETPGQVDALALPVQRQKGDALLAMLDQASGKGVAATVGAAGAPPGALASTYTRSEGLAVASFHAFVGGVFSSDPGDPLRVDAQALRRIDAAALRAAFQSSPSNPLVGLEGRAALLARLGEVLQEQAATAGGPARPGRLYDQLTEGGQRTEVEAAAILVALARDYAPIWPSGGRVLGRAAGDCWPHRWAGADTAEGPDATTAGHVPFHKLSQWLTYSLVEPLRWAGLQVTGLEALTGLPEYRNGGLLLDGGVIVPRDARDLGRTWKPADEFVIEWRALTVTLLDELAAQVRGLLGVDAARLPLPCILEGGTWAAGRQIARERRDGAPPVRIDSDGTVF